MKQSIDKRTTLENQSADTAQKVFASHRDQIAKGSSIVATFNGVPTIGNDSAKVSRRIGAWSRHKVSGNVSGSTLHDSRPMVERFNDRDENGKPLDAIGFASLRIARKVSAMFMRERLAWHAKELQAIGLAMLARATRKRETDMPYTKGSSFASALVTPSMLEEMTLAAALVIKARAWELSDGPLTYQEHGDGKTTVSLVYCEPVKAAFRAARRALTKGLEEFAIGIADDCETESPTATDEREAMQRASARMIQADVAEKRWLLKCYWRKSKSQRWKQGLVSDLRLLQMATRVVIGLPIPSQMNRNAFAIRIREMEKHVSLG